MSIDPDLLYDLLPAVYRRRDDQEREEPLRAVMEIITAQAAVVEENLRQLHDDQFVELASPWALPYLADLVGLRGLPGEDDLGMTPRAEVANTIAYRRRKGTAAVLEQVARDVTGWTTRAVEYFELIVATQQVNHVRPHNQAFVLVRDAARLAWVDTPFERRSGQADLPHLVDVRRIGSRRGRHNIPNVGIHAWRLREQARTRTPAVPVDPADQRRFLFDPLGTNTALVTRPVSESEITHLAEPVNVPLPISRWMLRDALGSYYGPGLSLFVDGVAAEDVVVCDLRDLVADDGTVTGWAHTPPPTGAVAIDPELGRVAMGSDRDTPPLVTHHDAFSADIGGGEYDRVGAGVPDGGLHVEVSQQDEGADHATIGAAVAAVGDGLDGLVEVLDSGRYVELPSLAATGRSLTIAAGDGRRPVLALSGELVLEGDDDGELTLSGLVVVGFPVRVRGLRRLRLHHCTLVPGVSLRVAGGPEHAGAASLVVESANTRVELESCVVGGLQVHPDASVVAHRSIVDATIEGVAYASDDGTAGGGPLRLEECTVLGKVHARLVDLVSNSIVDATVAASDDPSRWVGPLVVDRRQSGCIRFSWVPPGSRTPRRHQCQPVRDGDAARLRPVFTSTRYADPGYCQLSTRTADEVTRGAADESEMGVFHDLYQPQREQYLATRLDDYLRFGLEAGVLFAS